MKYLSILGATGSVGSQALDVIRAQPYDFKLEAVTANKDYSSMIAIIEEFSPSFVAMYDKDAYLLIKEYCENKNIKIELQYGLDGLNRAATYENVNIVLTSIVGMIGLVPTIEAIKSGKDIALANKETMVVAGELVNYYSKKHNVNILPVDSEHSAVFQCLKGKDDSDEYNVILTASGGPFKGKTKDELKFITPEQALKHPNWNMGKKISIDSSTLMNKGLEVIEAHWLFNVCYDNIKVVIHPQSIIHSMVEYNDGSVIAQLAEPDMRLPIQYALDYPLKKKSVIKKLDFYNMKSLTFEKPDLKTFSCLQLAYEAGKIGGTMPTVLNAANEVAVELFLQKKINYLQIPEIIEESMKKFNSIEKPGIDEILYTEKEVKDYLNHVYNK